MPERWQDGHIFSLEAMPNGGPLAAAACSDGAVRIWRLGQGAESLEAHAICQASAVGMGSSCCWSADGTRLACSSTDGSLVMLVSFIHHLFIILGSWPVGILALNQSRSHQHT